MKTLHFEINFDDVRPSRPDLGWGRIRLLVDDVPVWDDNGQGIEWTLVDFLEFLGRAWVPLLAEETWPVVETSSWPLNLRKQAESRWADMDDDQIDREEAELDRFLSHHDLAWAFNGLYVSSVVLVRHGTMVLVTVPEDRLKCVISFEDMTAELERVGNVVAERIAESLHPRAIAAVTNWKGRSDIDVHKAVEKRTGLPREDIRRIEQDMGENEEMWFGGSPDKLSGDSPILAAARMSAGLLTHDARIEIMLAIRSLPQGSFSKLERLSQDLSHRHFDAARPYELGYEAAMQVRNLLGFADTDRVDPERVLRELDVYLGDPLNIDDASLDAIAVWGPTVGPAVLINKGNLSRASHPNGLRSTYAHELCHLLLDRDGALPVGELLGGKVPVLPEKRARAFAAEFLLPRAAAAGVVRGAESIVSALRDLAQTYLVSEELAAWQIENSPVAAELPDEWRSTLASRLRIASAPQI